MRYVLGFVCILSGCAWISTINISSTLAKTEAAEVTLENAAMPAIDAVCSARVRTCQDAKDDACVSAHKCFTLREDVAKGFILFHLAIADASSAYALSQDQDAADALTKAIDLLGKIRSQLSAEGIL